MIITLKKFKSLDTIIKYLVITCIVLAVYSVYVAYMTFVVNSTLPFARYEELIVIAALLVFLALVIYLRSRYLKFKNNK